MIESSFEDDESEVQSTTFDKDLYIKIINNLFRNKSVGWVREYNQRSDYENFVLMRWLMRYDSIRVQVRWLDKYVNVLPKSMFLSLVWTVIPKIQDNERIPNFDGYKSEVEVVDYKLILDKVRRQFKLSDNDYAAVKDRIIASIKKDGANWFSYYGVPRAYWKKYKQNFDLIKEFEDKVQVVGLQKWGLN
jgi:hypothetical protein